MACINCHLFCEQPNLISPALTTAGKNNTPVYLAVIMLVIVAAEAVHWWYSQESKLSDKK
jgi:hypothetical protein